MSPFGENFRGGQEKVICPLCNNHMDSQSLALNCEEIRKEVQIKLKIEDIYREHITLETASNLLEIETERKKLIKEL